MGMYKSRLNLTVNSWFLRTLNVSGVPNPDDQRLWSTVRFRELEAINV